MSKRRADHLQKLEKLRRFWELRRDARFSLDKFSRFDYIFGDTLKRLRYLGFEDGLYVFASRVPSYNDRVGQCDMCTRRHRPTNLSCSRTLGVETYARSENVVYSPVTRRPVGGQWVLVSTEAFPRSTILVERYTIKGFKPG